ncbi:MAG TPA: glycine betaine ABC transporter substrate-binding protein, partial [Candidatus Binatia bacterium]
MKRGRLWRLVLAAALIAGCGASREERVLLVGSKNFTEGVILGELARSLIEYSGQPATHRRALGGTRLVFNALVAGDLDVYAEYTGTLGHEILAS